MKVIKEKPAKRMPKSNTEGENSESCDEKDMDRSQGEKPNQAAGKHLRAGE